MKEQFVPYEIAIKLKQKGFDEPCIAGYQCQIATLFSDIPHTLEGNIHRNNEGSFTCAPLWQQVIDWFREKHSLDIMTRQFQLDGKTYYKITKIETEDKIKGYSNFCKSPYEAREKAIEQALTLI